MRIRLLALEGFWDTGLTVTLDAFTLANEFSRPLKGGSLPFRRLDRRRAEEGPVGPGICDARSAHHAGSEAGLGDRAGVEYRTAGTVAGGARTARRQAGGGATASHGTRARTHRRVLHRHLRAGGDRAARWRRSDHDVVAVAAVSPTLSECAARRDAHAGDIGPRRHRGRRDGASRSCALVHTPGEPGARQRRVALPACRTCAPRRRPT